MKIRAGDLAHQAKCAFICIFLFSHSFALSVIAEFNLFNNPPLVDFLTTYYEQNPHLLADPTTSPELARRFLRLSEYADGLQDPFLAKSKARLKLPSQAEVKATSQFQLNGLQYELKETHPAEMILDSRNPVDPLPAAALPHLDYFAVPGVKLYRLQSEDDLSRVRYFTVAQAQFDGKSYPMLILGEQGWSRAEVYALMRSVAELSGSKKVILSNRSPVSILPTERLPEEQKSVKDAPIPPEKTTAVRSTLMPQGWLTVDIHQGKKNRVRPFNDTEVSSGLLLSVDSLPADPDYELKTKKEEPRKLSPLERLFTNSRSHEVTPFIATKIISNLEAIGSHGLLEQARKQFGDRFYEQSQHTLNLFRTLDSTLEGARAEAGTSLTNGSSFYSLFGDSYLRLPSFARPEYAMAVLERLQPTIPEAAYKDLAKHVLWRTPEWSESLYDLYEKLANPALAVYLAKQSPSPRKDRLLKTDFHHLVQQSKAEPSALRSHTLLSVYEALSPAEQKKLLEQEWSPDWLRFKEVVAENPFVTDLLLKTKQWSPIHYQIAMSVPLEELKPVLVPLLGKQPPTPNKYRLLSSLYGKVEAKDIPSLLQEVVKDERAPAELVRKLISDFQRSLPPSPVTALYINSLLPKAFAHLKLPVESFLKDIDPTSLKTTRHLNARNFLNEVRGGASATRDQVIQAVVSLLKDLEHGANHFNSLYLNAYIPDTFAELKAPVALDKEYFQGLMRDVNKYANVGTLDSRDPFFNHLIEATLRFRYILRGEKHWMELGDQLQKLYELNPATTLNFIDVLYEQHQAFYKDKSNPDHRYGKELKNIRDALLSGNRAAELKPKLAQFGKRSCRQIVNNIRYYLLPGTGWGLIAGSAGWTVYELSQVERRELQRLEQLAKPMKEQVDLWNIELMHFPKDLPTKLAEDTRSFSEKIEAHRAYISELQTNSSKRTQIGVENGRHWSESLQLDYKKLKARWEGYEGKAFRKSP